MVYKLMLKTYYSKNQNYNIIILYVQNMNGTTSLTGHDSQRNNKSRVQNKGFVLPANFHFCFEKNDFSIFKNCDY